MFKIRSVGCCPRCKDIRTGIVRYEKHQATFKEMQKYANQGLYFKISLPYSGVGCGFNPPTAFCSKCGYEWLTDEEEIFWLPKDEYMEYLEERRLDEASILRPLNFSGKLKSFIIKLLPNLKGII